LIGIGEKGDGKTKKKRKEEKEKEKFCAADGARVCRNRAYL